MDQAQMKTGSIFPSFTSTDADDVVSEVAAKGGAAGDATQTALAEQEEVCQIVAEGNGYLRSGQFREAISHYSESLRLLQALLAMGMSTLKVNHLLILSNRSSAFAGLSKKLRSIPAAQSERRALFDLDPLSLAELALKDADKLIREGGEMWPKAHYRRAQALLLLERYAEAADSLLEGLHLEPSNDLLQAALRELRANREGRSPEGEGERGDVPSSEGPSGPAGPQAEGLRPYPEARQGAALCSATLPQTALGEQQQQQLQQQQRQRRKRGVERSDEFDCSLCLKLFYAPVTTPCGHTFCRPCLARALDHGNKCPVCRIALFLNPSTQPVSVTLKNILERHFPEEYQERKEEVEAEKLLVKETLPLFVMDVVLPRQRMALNIFEPRYRLMVRRAMEGSRRMGMVGFDEGRGQIADVACEVEIKECEPQPDGRFHLEVEGARRFRIAKSWEMDGYRVAQVEWMQDADGDASAGSGEALPQEAVAGTAAAAQEAADAARVWLEKVQVLARGAWRQHLAEHVRNAGDMPPPMQPEKLSFWIANLLPTQPRERLRLLRMTSSRERLSHELRIMKTEGFGSPSCSVQ